MGLSPFSGDRPLSKLIETRVEFQQPAQDRLEEAKALLDVEKWGGAAYYLAGYAVELGLKACIIKILMAKPTDEGKWFHYLASPAVDEKRPATAHRIEYGVLPGTFPA